jgi:hypothetical protein
MTASLWQRLGCCLTGHDYSVRSDSTRMFVRCKTCGHTSRGFVMPEDPVRKRSYMDRAAAGVVHSSVSSTRLAAR